MIQMYFTRRECVSVNELLWINTSANVFFLGDLDVHHKISLAYSVRIDRLANSVITYISQTILRKWLAFQLRSLTLTHSSALLDLFLSSDPSIYSAVAFLASGNSDHVVGPVGSNKLKRECPFSSCSWWQFSCWLGWFLWEMFHGRISLNIVLLVLVLNFVSGFRMELMYISLIENNR